MPQLARLLNAIARPEISACHGRRRVLEGFVSRSHKRFDRVILLDDALGGAGRGAFCQDAEVQSVMRDCKLSRFDQRGMTTGDGTFRTLPAQFPQLGGL
ncbi:hypothetical protein ACF1BQ_028930 [Bradyrhizobium sp. RDT10]